MDKRIREGIVATLAVAGAAASLYFAFAGRSPKFDLDPYEILGVVTAEETSKLLGNKGQVLLMAPDTGANKNPSVEAEIKTFQETLKKQKGISVITEQIPVTPMLMMATGGGVPAEQLFKALETHAGVGAMVLFFAFPNFSEPELDALKKHGVKTVVVSSLRSGYKRLLERGAIHLVIAPRPESLPEGRQAPRTLRDRFDDQFSIITPADAGRL